MKNLNEYRHKWEMPMLWICGCITLLGVIAFIVIGVEMVYHPDLVAWVKKDEYWEYLIGAPLVLAYIYVSRVYMTASIVTGAIQANERQFPELYARYCALAAQIELAQVPKLYVLNGNGVLNAYALSCNKRRKIVVIHAEIAQLFDTDPGVVEFVLAHELSHHKLHHVSYWRILLNLLPNILVLPGKAMTRSQEYSADRMAATITSEAACCGVITLLSAGGKMYSKVNMQAYREQYEETQHEPLTRVANWFSDHPVLTKRYDALVQLKKSGLSAQGEMF
jgi:Zn-dependent protease with chaperone function